jgi:hypothetical protein
MIIVNDNGSAIRAAYLDATPEPASISDDAFRLQILLDMNNDTIRVGKAGGSEHGYIKVLS